MNTHDKLELLPLPKGEIAADTCPVMWVYSHEQMQEYARKNILEKLRSIWQPFTQSNVDRMSVEDIKNEIECMYWDTYPKGNGKQFMDNRNINLPQPAEASMGETAKPFCQPDLQDYFSTLLKERDELLEAASAAGFSFLRHVNGSVQMVPQIKGEAQQYIERTALAAPVAQEFRRS